MPKNQLNLHNEIFFKLFKILYKIATYMFTYLFVWLTVFKLYWLNKKCLFSEIVDLKIGKTKNSFQ